MLQLIGRQIGKFAFNHACAPFFTFIFLCADSDREDDTVEVVENVPTLDEIHLSIGNLRSFLQSRENVPDQIYKSLNLVEVFVENEKWRAKTQKKITDFFNKRA